jgi:phenylalanyl-tRNA synthetase beta chain
MPTVKLNRKVFEKLVGKKLSENELKERMAMIGTDLESVDDKEIVVEVFPDRPDMLSEQGFSRAFRSFLGVETGLKKYDVKKSGYKVIVDAVPMRQYIVCAIVKGLTFTDERIREVMQAQEKLSMTHGRQRRKSEYGVYPLQSITFPVTYCARDPSKISFQPLGFDHKICADQVAELHPTGKKYGYISKDWKKYPFLIDANDNVMAMMPFTNSHDTGKIDLDTTDVFVECTGTDFMNIWVALNMFVSMFADMGGEIYGVDVVYKDQTKDSAIAYGEVKGNDKIVTTPDFTPREMKLDLVYVNKRLGLELTKKEADICLEKMGFGIDGENVLIPVYRADVMHQCDLVEDIGIAYGYENFEEEIPAVATIAEEDPFEIFKNRVANLLVGVGLLESSNYHLIDKEVQTTQMGVTMDVLEILDPVSEGFNSLRAWILPGLLQTLQINRTHEYPQKFFEIGRVFKKDLTKDALADEFERLAVVLAHDSVSYTEARQIIDYLLRMLGLEYDVVESSLGCFLPGRCARVVLKNGVKVAYVGEVAPQVLENFGMEMPVCGFELNLSEIWKVVKE